MRSVLMTKVLCVKQNKIGDSVEVSVAQADDVSVSLSFSEDAQGVKVSFWMSSNGKDFHLVEGVACDDQGTFMTSTGRPQLYSFDVSAGLIFKIKLEEIVTGMICADATGFAVM